MQDANPFQLLQSPEEEDSESTISTISTNSDTFTESTLKSTSKSTKKSREKVERRRKREKLTNDLDNAWKQSNAKFTFKVIELLKIIHDQLLEFVKGETEMLALPGMPTELRKIFIFLAEHNYNLAYRVRGHHKHKCLALYRKKQNIIGKVDATVDVDKMLKHALMATHGVDMEKVLHDQMTIVSDGAIVGANAKPLDVGNVGFRMFQSMGWSPDSSSSTGDNRLLVKVKKDRAGLK